MRQSSIAVIGGGPAGMSFCHAVETMSREGNVDSSIQTSITCFERTTRPGGQWKEADPTSKTNMYEELWTNGPSHNIEFPDYTFDEHFGRPVPVYLPRADVLGYLCGRVTKNCPRFFDKYFQFGTEVSNVKFDDEKQRFLVTTRSVATDKIQVQEFDKVVWACGEHGKHFIPQSLKNLFKDFNGRVMHSSETENLERDFGGKRVLFVGGGYSAEDLALQACKLGVEKAYICSRKDEPEAFATLAWPHNKVEALIERGPIAIGEDGRSIKLAPTELGYGDSCTYLTEGLIEIRDIDIVVFCTGYATNFDMLSDGLCPKHCRKTAGQVKLDVPTDWTMPENVMTKFVGNIPPDQTCYSPDFTVPELFRGVLITNPNMMFVWMYHSEYPLLTADVSAWLLARYCVGGLELPTREEMQRLNREHALQELAHPFIRKDMDVNYFVALMDAFEQMNGELDDTWDELEIDRERCGLQLLAGHMRAANYQMNIGSDEELNDAGETLLHFDYLSYGHRVEITPEVIEVQPNKTFRDYDNATEFYSIHTGTKAISLGQPWLEIGRATEPKW